MYLHCRALEISWHMTYIETNEFSQHNGSWVKKKQNYNLKNRRIIVKEYVNSQQNANNKSRLVDK